MAKIYIDPGHGGSDPGASGGGLVEKAWALFVALELARLLRSKGHSVRLSRTSDATVGLNARTADANRWGADLFISIHFNAGGGFGWEDFIFNGRVSNSTKNLQRAIHTAIRPVLVKHGLGNRGMKSANFAVLRQTNAPAILVEGGFVDTSDRTVLAKTSYQKDVAVGIANGVQSYLGLGKVGNVSLTTVAKWVRNNTGWWYREANGNYPKGGWKLINKQWYLFDNRGYMLTGWQKTKGTWYHMNSSGHMQKGWQFINKKWYYMNSSGAMQTGWIMPSKTWYYLSTSGSMLTGWVLVGSNWYFLNKSGHMQTGLVEVGGSHFMLRDNGALVENEVVKLQASKGGYLS